MATGATHPYGGRVPRYPLWTHRDSGAIIGPAYVALSTLGATPSGAVDPGDSARATNKTAIEAAVVSVAAQGKILLVDGVFWWDAGASAGLNLSAIGLRIIGRTRQAFPSFNGDMDGFVGQVSTAPTSPKNGLNVDSTTGQELWAIKVVGVGASVRGSLPGHHGLFARNVVNFTVAVCEFQDATATSLIFNGFSGVYLGRVHTTGGLADAFQFTTGEGPGRNGYLENCWAHRPGDDYYSCVGYNGQGTNKELIGVTIRNSGGQSTSGLSRVAVIGGENILYKNLNVRDCGSKGIHCATEVAFGTGLVNDVTFDTVCIGECGVALSGTANAAFSVDQTTAYPITNVEYVDCVVGKMNTSSVAIVFTGTLVNGVTLTNCSSPSTAAAGLQNLGCQNVTLDASTVTSSGNHAVFLGTAGTTNFTLRNGCIITCNANNFNGVNQNAALTNTVITGNTISGPSASAGNCILVDGGGAGLTITNNTLTRAAQDGVRVMTVAPTGTVNISNNTISDIGKIGTNPEAFIDPVSIEVNCPSATLLVNGNTHNNPNSNEYQFDWDVASQTTSGAHQCMNNVRGTNTGGTFANYASDAPNDQGSGVRAQAAAGWTISGNT